MFDTPVLPRLLELLEEIRDGLIGIPEFQRGYVWSDEQRLRLMDSIWRGIPIGSLLVWMTMADKGLQVRTKIGPCKLAARSATGTRRYLVDGVQRVTTLYAALMPLPDVVERDQDGRRWPIYFDLDPESSDDLRFRLRSGQQAVPPTWIPLPCLLDDVLFLEFRVQLANAGRRDLLQETRRLESRFRDYVVPVMPMVSDDQDLVTEAFARVNSQGQDLDEGDMAHALTLGSSFSFNSELATITEQLSPLGWDGIERKTLIGALKAIWNLDLYKSGAKGIKKKLESSEGRDLLRALPVIFGPVADVFRTFGVHGPGSLPYSYQVVAILKAVYDLGPDRVKQATETLRRWFFWTTYNEHFTGMTSGQLGAEFERVTDIIQGRPLTDHYSKPRVGPITKLRANAVRSRAAILVMALAGDRESGDDRQQRLYGARGTAGLHRLYPQESAYEIANRVLADEAELARLRVWARVPADTLPSMVVPEEDLLRRHLISPLQAGCPREAKSVLGARTALLLRTERDFVEELGGAWEAPEAEP